MLPWFKPCSRPDSEPCDCCWTWSDFSLATDDEAMLQRRLSMCLILAVRTIMSVLRVWYHRSGTSVLGVTFDVVCSVADIAIPGLMLSRISKVQGPRRVPILGIHMNRRRFDISLFLCAIFHVITLSVTFGGWEPSYDNTCVMWLAVPQILESRPREDLVVKA